MKLFITIFLLYASHSVSAVDVATEFTNTGVVPDALDKAPNDLLQVSFKENEKDRIVNVGEELTPTFVKDEPSLAWASEDSAFYTITLIDLDPPSHEDPSLREMLHWLVTNVPGNDLKKGDVLAEYVGSGPGKDTGLHRYVYLVYKQPEKLIFDEKVITNHERSGRPKFSIKNFAEKYKLGQPIAGNMYRAQYDDYVPILRKQLDGTS